MKKHFKVLTGIIIVALLLSVTGINASAQGAYVSANRSSVNPGNSVTVTCRFDAGIGMYYFKGSLAYNPSIMSYVSGGDSNTGSSINVVPNMSGEGSYSFSVTFNAIAAGTANFTFTGEGSDGISKPVLSGSCSVTVSNPTPQPPTPQKPDTPSSQKSSDANLVSIKVSGANLSPEFSPSVYNYTAPVKYTVDKATLSVTAPSSATFVGAGTFDLNIGNNSHVVTVTAADGKTKKSYTVNIYRMNEQETKQAEENEKNANPLVVKVDGESLTITPDIASLGIYEGYSVEKVVRGATEIGVLKDNKGKYNLYYMTDSKGKGSYYNAVSENKFEPVDFIVSGARLYIVNRLPKGAKLAKRYITAKLEIDGRKMPAVKFTDSAAEDIYIVYCYYGGENAYYRYDALEKSVSRAPEFAGTLTKSTAKETSSMPGFIQRFLNMSSAGKIVFALMILATAGIILIVVFALSKGSKKQEYGHVVGDVSFDDLKKLENIEIIEESDKNEKYDE